MYVVKVEIAKAIFCSGTSQMHS